MVTQLFISRNLPPPHDRQFESEVTQVWQAVRLQLTHVFDEVKYEPATQVKQLLFAPAEQLRPNFYSI